MSSAQPGPFCDGFLHPAFAEVALPGGDQRRDLIGGMSFGDGNKGDIGRGAFRPGGGGTNRLANSIEP